MKLFKSALIYSLLLFIGLFLFWLQYRHLDWPTIKKGLLETNYFWIFVSVVLGLVSHLSRAIRWKMLIKPMGYDPKVSNIFLSLLSREEEKLPVAPFFQNMRRFLLLS
jgi:uncharacterized membrane protein YbhN (UPF0104 family)